MKIKFKKQQYQTNAVEAVVDCFIGQPQSSGIQYRIDPGRETANPNPTLSYFPEESGFKNADIAITQVQLLKNIQNVQRRENSHSHKP